MPESKTAKKSTAKSTARRSSGTEVWSDEELAIMQEHARDMKKAAKKGADGEKDILAKIEEMDASDRAIAEKVHAIVKEHAPDLAPRTWYGMPAYTRDGKNVVFFQAAAKFKARYATLGFDEGAKLDEGDIWPTSWAITKLTPTVEAEIVRLVKKAAG
jgi:uncharacterized protein YdhG (YjbR/CyaY superfamily)